MWPRLCSCGDVLAWAYPARSASYYERKVQNTAFFSFSVWKYLINLNQNLGIGFLSTHKFDTTTRNTSTSHGMQTFGQGSYFNWTTWHSLFTSSHQSLLLTKDLASTELLRKVSKSWARVFFWEIYVPYSMSSHIWHHFNICQKEFIIPWSASCSISSSYIKEL